MGPEALLGILIWYPAFLVSVTFHEAAHAWVALLGGDRTAYLGGQVSLSPLPHMKREPIGMVVVPLLTAATQGWAMGWASAPYNRAWAEAHPRRAAWMAAAGPAANLAIAIVALIALKVGLAAGFFAPPDRILFDQLVIPAAGPGGVPGFIAAMLSVLVMLNTILFAFNLIPLPPLDGAAVIGLLLPESIAKTVRGLAASPQFSLVGLLVAWTVFPKLVRPLFTTVVNLLHPGMYGIG